jgi:hypothetical protein
VGAKWWILLSVVAAVALLPVTSGASTKRPFASQLAQPNQVTFQDSTGEALPVAPLGAFGNRVTFRDSTDEAPPSADIATVSVLDRDEGYLAFQVVLGRRFSRGITVVAYLDTDRNVATGSPAFFGADYAFLLFDGSECCAQFSGWTLRRWNGTTFSKGSFRNYVYSDLTAGVLTFDFDSADIGRPSGFNFAVATDSKSQSRRRLDRAPNTGQAPWSFDSTVGGLASADVATVVVSNDDLGVLTFQVVLAAQLPQGLTVAVYIDSDRNPRTGAPTLFGANYALVFSNLREEFGLLLFDASLGRWDGTSFRSVFQKVEPLVNRVLTYSFHSDDLGRPSGFNFVVTTASQGMVSLDRAPDPGQAPWGFNMKVRPVRLSVARFTTKPQTPRAGREFLASMRFTASAVVDLFGAVEGVSCKARVAGKPLVEGPWGVSQYVEIRVGHPNDAGAECGWRIPPRTSGKLFRGSVTATFRGSRKSLTRSFSARITR